MNRDWIGAAATDLDLIDASVRYVPKFLSTAEADALLATLSTEIDWQQHDITLFGKTYAQPRLIAWHGDAGANYRYSGTNFAPAPWTPALSDLRRRLASEIGVFNSVLVNLYRDHRDSMGMHADDEAELGPEPLIASISLGAVRPFVMKHRQRPAEPTVRVPLAHGSLLTMSGTTQRYWKHGLPKRTRAHGPRINLTFRHVITA